MRPSRDRQLASTRSMSCRWRASQRRGNGDPDHRHGGRAVPGWWDQIRPYSLGWVTARLPGGGLAGFVNVAWDGGDHAFLLDTKVARGHQRQGIATALAGHAVRHAQAAGCEWLHVDSGPRLAAFYLDACGFQSTPAGVITCPATGMIGSSERTQSIAAGSWIPCVV
jgi:GNAT superfamily N-acetyltransferase